MIPYRWGIHGERMCIQISLLALLRSAWELPQSAERTLCPPSEEKRPPRSSAEFQFRAALQDHVSVDQGSDSKSDHERKKITQKKGSASLCEALQSTMWKKTGVAVLEIWDGTRPNRKFFFKREKKDGKESNEACVFPHNCLNNNGWARVSAAYTEV